MNLKFNKSVILYIFLFIPFFKPVSLIIYSRINSFFLIWKFVSLAIGLIIIYNEYKGKIITYKKDLWFNGLFLFFLIYLINCFSISKEFLTIVSNFLTIFELLILLSNRSNIKKNKNMIIAIDFIFSLLLLLQILSVLYIKSGHILFEVIENDYTYFLGTDNYSAFATIPMLGVVLFAEYNNFTVFSKLKRIFFCLGLCVTYVYTGAVTAALVTFFVVFVYVISKYNKVLLTYFTIKRVILLSFIILFLIMAFDIQNYFLWLLKLVGKSAKATTLNSRTIIWSRAFNLIKHNFLFGIGELTEQQINNYVLYGMGHAHNIFLDLMIKTGLVGTIGFLFFYSGILAKYSKVALKNSGFILVITIIAYFILSMMDDYPFMPYIYTCFGLLWGKCKFNFVRKGKYEK